MTVEPVERIHIATLKRSRTDELRLELYRLPDGRWRFGARIWFSSSDGKLSPSREGVAVPVEILPEFASAVTAAVKEARERAVLE